MKKDQVKRLGVRVIVLLILGALTFINSGCGIVEDETTGTHGTTLIESLEDLVKYVKTPQQLGVWCKVNLSYKADGDWSDEFRSAQETFNLGYGDCDDFAEFTRYIMARHGYICRIMCIYSSATGHAITVLEINGELNYFTNGRYNPAQIDTYDNLAKYVMPDYSHYIFHGE